MKFYAVVYFALILGSCDKYLDKPGDPTKKVPKTVNDVLLMLDKSVSSGPIVIGTDEFFTTDQFFQTSMPEKTRYYYTTWNPNPSGSFIRNDYWSLPYNTIFIANLSLEVLAEASVTPANQKNFNLAKGSAYFQRAFALTTIAWQYAKSYNENTAKTDPGAVIDLHSDVTEKLRRSTVEETYHQILSDLEESLKYLPLAADHPLRPSQLAARGLLARVYLSMRKYDKALEQCNLVLQSRNELIDFNNSAEMNISATYPMAVHRYGKEMIYSKTSYTSATQIGALSFYLIDTNLVASYAPDDLRSKAWFRKNPNGYSLFKASYESAATMSGICVNEIYITRAECYARANEIDKAMKDLNDLLITRWKTGSFTPFTASTKEEALAIILRERKKELLTRGLRWMDIKRLNEEGANIKITRKVGNKLYELPPQDPRFACQIPHIIVLDYGYTQNPLE